MHEVLKCSFCGKVIMVLEEGGRRTICCDQQMDKLPEQNDGKIKPDHTPVIAKTRKGIIVKAGGVSDPMEEGHYIAWIEISGQGTRMIKNLGPEITRKLNSLLAARILKFDFIAPGTGSGRTNQRDSQNDRLKMIKASRGRMFCIWHYLMGHEIGSRRAEFSPYDRLDLFYQL